MAKQRVSTVMPRLRFPEFRSAKTWTTIELRQLSEFVTERVGTTDCTPYTVSSGVGLVSQQEKLGRTIAGNSLKNYIVLQKNDFAYNKSATKAFPQGFIARYVGEDRAAVPNSIFTCFRTNDDLIDPTYLDNLFSTNLHGNWLRNRIAVGARAHGSLNVSDEDLMDLPVPLPAGSSSLTEQQKIADCLTSLDEVIAAQGRIVAALKAHKRGLMQQLFPHEGETRPRLRVPEFRDASEWITRPLGELMVIGSSRRVHESDWMTTGVPFYRAREIVAIGKGEPINPLFISEDLYTEFTGFTGEIEEGQLLVTGVGSIGIPYLVKSDDRFYFKDGNIIWLKNNQADLLGDFLLRLFESDYVQGQIAKMAGIGTVGTYTIENAKRTIAVFPLDKGEQQRIADCLSSLDTQITAESHQLAALKTHKQGLMQQLFPSREVVAA